MKTGDVVTDSLGRTWQVGQALGRGLWGTSWVLRRDDGHELVAKIAHGRADFPADARLPEGIERACATCADEQAALLKKAPHPFLPRLEDRLLVGGRPALLVPRYATSLARHLASGAPLSELLGLLAALADHAGALAAAGTPHGNLHLDNVLLKDDGTPVLADALTPTAAAWRARLAALAPTSPRSLPPEADRVPHPTWDTWALCAGAWAAATWQPGTDPALPAARLDKVEIATLRDRAMKRLKAEGANPRFVGRACERLASLLNRGLSEPTEPSPPYRFHDPAALADRLREVEGLIHPSVASVGKILFPASAPDGTYTGGEDVTFSVTVGVTANLGGPDHVACGLRLTDLDAPDHRRVPIEDASFDVKTHPSGRLRFHFTLRKLPPGRYGVQAAFTVQDSGDDPVPTSAEITVRAPAGYVPPAPETPDPPRVLTLPETREIDDPVQRDADRMPTPIAPTGSAPTVGTSPTAIPTPTEAPPTEAPPPPVRPGPVSSVADTETLSSAPTVPSEPSTADLPLADDPPAPNGWDGPPDPEPPPGSAESWLPTGDVTDLPEWSAEDARERPAWARWLEVGRRDTFTAIVFVTALVVVAIVAVSWLLRACAG